MCRKWPSRALIRILGIGFINGVLEDYPWYAYLSLVKFFIANFFLLKSLYTDLYPLFSVR